MKKYLCLFVVMGCLCTAIPGSAADVGVTINLDRREATTADTVRLEVSVSDTRSGVRPHLAGMDAFTVTEGGRSTRVEIVNGAMSEGITYTYFLQPKKTGHFTIGPATVTANGRTVESKTVSLDVADAAASGTPEDLIFFEAEIADADVYVDEQTILTLKLYRRVTVGELSLSFPDMEYLNYAQIRQSREYMATRGGKEYRVLDVAYALTSSRAGTYEITPISMKMIVLQQSRSPFDEFFFSTRSGRPYVATANAVKLTVHALPDKEKPAGFTGLVGQFVMEAHLEPKTVSAGESATLTLVIEGRGNANRIPDMAAPEIDGVRAYADQPVLETMRDEKGAGGRKTMKWALVPETAGRYELPGCELIFFDPNREEYVTVMTPDMVLLALPGADKGTRTQAASGGNASVETLRKKAVRQIGEDILPLHTAASGLVVPLRSLTRGWRLWTAVFGPAIAYLLCLVGVTLRRKSPERLSKVRTRNAPKVLARKTRAPETGPVSLIDAFTEYLNDRFGISLGTVTVNDVELVLTRQGVRAETVAEVRSIVHRLEEAVYAGGEKTQDTPLARTLRDVVARIEKDIR